MAKITTRKQRCCYAGSHWLDLRRWILNLTCPGEHAARETEFVRQSPVLEMGTVACSFISASCSIVVAFPGLCVPPRSTLQGSRERDKPGCCIHEIRLRAESV
ncbi:predicted protein [Coccidioides posadasii str. Silveira]|uniref:Predicted protein n=1 Tax=Coccidioides posadasii (strain RMSCC 757 / Silveira) TaxID=443226 RepID=E9CRY0_COCPS|nr:predicted protein [Coccidioides posadasii str. Silveira]